MKTEDGFFLRATGKIVSEKYYYTHDIIKLFNINGQSLSRLIKIGVIPQPVIVKENHLRVRRWNKDVIDMHLSELEKE